MKGKMWKAAAEKPEVVAPSGLPGKTARIKQNFVAIRSQFKNLLAAANSRLMFSFFPSCRSNIHQTMWQNLCLVCFMYGLDHRRGSPLRHE